MVKCSCQYKKHTPIKDLPLHASDSMFPIQCLPRNTWKHVESVLRLPADFGNEHTAAFVHGRVSVVIDESFAHLPFALQKLLASKWNLGAASFLELMLFHARLVH